MSAIGENDRLEGCVVGIGASAGGLQAIETLFDHMPNDSGMSFVIVQHLSPKYKSLMDNLLAKHTTMSIKIAEHGDVVSPNTVYLIPPNMHMTVEHRVLNLTEREGGRNLDLPIDIFFASLAEDLEERAVGIVLSGTGSDGAQGIRAIHERNGLVIVQDPDSAQFDGMPSSALKTEVADYVLLPEQMPACLLEFTRSPLLADQSSSLTPSERSAHGLEAVIRLLRKKYLLDMSKYKEHTFHRRLYRRMALRNIADVEEYVEVLKSDGDEMDSLYKDLLIGVTSFFRDTEYWVHLKQYLAKHLPLPASQGKDIRIWVAGCATGEEAYSVAIICQELADERDDWGSFTIFATDIHAASLEVASAGFYSEDRLDNVSSQRLQRFFQQEDSGLYRVDPELRKHVVFSPHNLTSDPPFIKVSLICCRNVLIYIKPEAQKKIISLFHYALHPGGVLFLGSSEGLTDDTGGFEAIRQKEKLFRKDGDGQPYLDFPDILRSQGTATIPSVTNSILATKNNVSMGKDLLADYDMVLEKFMPPSVLVDKDYRVLHYFGDGAAFLRPPSGRVEKSVLDMLPDDRLHAAIAVG